MNSKLLCTDVLAIRCISDFVLVAIGCTLHIFNRISWKLLEKIKYPYSCNIHGFVNWEDRRIAAFGANSICIYDVTIEDNTLKLCEHKATTFKDWIIAVSWLLIENQLHFSVLFAHNNVHVYDLSFAPQRNVQCEEQCILYGGSMSVGSDKDLTIFSGTVFQEILIWQINQEEPCLKTLPVLHRLTGHNGVIFSVVYEPLERLICSTSDDRTVRLWKVSDENDAENNEVDWKRVDVKLMKTMFGHAARVWRSVIRNGTLITIGEDSLMCTWSLAGKLLNKTYAHHGAAIWSIDVPENNENILTGGADGSVHVWDFANDYSERVISLSEKDARNVLKCVCSLSSGTLLVLDETGTLLSYNKGECRPRDSLCLKKYSSYCIMQVSPCRSYVSLASRDGHVAIYHEIDGTTEKVLERILEERVTESQIFSLHWLTSDTMIACGANGKLKVFSFTIGGLTQQKALFSLPASRERWLTAATIYNELLVCGDRAGNMYVYKFLESDEISQVEELNEPTQSFAKAHGRIGIQTFTIQGAKLVTAGRDGTLRFFEARESEKDTTLRALHREKMPMDWISGTIKHQDYVLVVGFKEVEFVIYSMFHRRVLARIPCGGGHRSWDCMILEESLTFAYIRNKQVFVFGYPLKFAKMPILLNGFHSKEVYCMQPISKVNGQTIFLSGGEDGALRVTRIAKNFGFETLGVFDGHISSIKCMASKSLKSGHFERYVIFSGGGRAQLKVWEINVVDVESKNVEVSCCDLTSHMLYGLDKNRRKPWQDTKQSYAMNPETRYMDMEIYVGPPDSSRLLLFVACADGFLRIFLYDTLTTRIDLKMRTKHVDRCILKMHILLHQGRVVVLTMSTDGTVRFFDFTDFTSNAFNNASVENDECRNLIAAPFHEIKLHQSGINSFDLKSVGEEKYLLATGGDDNLFSITYFKVLISDGKKSPEITVLSKWLTSSAHSAQITGIRFKHGSQICSVGMDQEIILYSYECTSDVLSAKILKKTFTSVADVQGLALWPSATNESLTCIYGKGFEVFSLDSV